MTTLFDEPRAETTIQLTPERREWWLRLTLLSPASHHDPGQRDKSNKSLFRRQAQRIELRELKAPPTQETVNSLLAQIPVPVEAANILQEATPPQFLAAALLQQFIALYSSREGEGLFSGTERYKYLEERFSHGAVQSANLYELWGRACAALQVPAPGYDESAALLALLSMPSVLAQQTLHVLAATPRPCVMLARLWNDCAKRQSAEYAKSAGAAQADAETVTLHYTVDSLRTETPEMIVDMPVVSANTLRHQLVREPGMWHLYNALGLAFDEPLPATTAMFYNGGDIKPGAQEPSGVFWVRKAIRDTFPLLALISGSTDSFIVGEGNLNVYAWVRCRENNRALRRAGLETELSVFDMIDEWTLTRHSNRIESGQMPFSFETLVAGTEIVANLSLTPYAGDLEIGALMAALNTYQETDSTVGGQSARGFGLLDLDFHNCEPDTEKLHAYEEYLHSNRADLRTSMLEGTFGTKKTLITG